MSPAIDITKIIFDNENQTSRVSILKSPAIKICSQDEKKKSTRRSLKKL